MHARTIDPRAHTHRFGFGGYSGGVSLRDGSTGGGEDAAGGSLDEDVARALRHVSQKSSPATKTKAMADLTEILFDGVDGGDGDDVGVSCRKSTDFMAALSRPWARAFDRLSGDGDAGCRLDASVLNGRIAVACGKSLGKILKTTSLVSAWLRAMCDPNVDVAAAAKRAFERTFSTDERRAMAVAVAHEVVLDDLCEILKRKKPSDMIFKDGSESEQFARFELSILSSLKALSLACERLVAAPGADSDSAANKLSQVLDDLNCLKVQISSEYASLRRAAYATLTALVARAADENATPAWKSALGGQVPKISRVSFALISSEMEAQGVKQMWELLLGIMTAHPSAWDAIDVEKSFMPGVRKHFKHGCFGGAATSALSLLPLLAHMPPKVLIGRGSDGTPMAGLLGILDAVFTGWVFLSSSAVRANEARAILPAMREGVLYGLLKLAPQTDHPGECASHVLMTRVADVWMREFLKVGNTDALDLMCGVLDTLSSKPHAKAATEQAWARIGEITEEALADPVMSEHANAMFARLSRSGRDSPSSQASEPFARAVLERAIQTPTESSVERLANLVASLGLTPFDGGAETLIKFSLESPAPPRAGSLVAAVLKHDQTWWDAVLRRTLDDDGDEEEALERSSSLVTLAEAIQAMPPTGDGLACDALDAIVVRCAAHASLASCSKLLVAVARAGIASTVSPSAAMEAYEHLTAGERRQGHSRQAMHAWMWPPPANEATTLAWSTAVGGLFAEYLLESADVVECVVHEAESDDEDGEAEIEYIELEVGDVTREWREIEKKMEQHDALSEKTRMTLATTVASAAASTAATQREEDAALALRLWATTTVRVLRLLGLDDDRVSELIVASDGSFYWLDAASHALGWETLLRSMPADARVQCTIDASSLPRSVTRRFMTALSASKDVRLSVFKSLAQSALSDAEDFSNDAALAHFLRCAHQTDARWMEGAEEVKVTEEILRVVGENLDTFALRAASIIPWILPADTSVGGYAAEFITRVVEDTLRAVGNRRMPLDGSKLQLVAACFSRGDDVIESDIVKTLGDDACSPLMDVFHDISKREAAEAAAEAAAARFGGGDQSGPSRPKSSSDAEVGIAAVIQAIIRRTPASLDTRDWGSIIGRLDAWTATRATKAEEYASGEFEDDSRQDAAVTTLHAAKILNIIDALPMELLEPEGSSAGDVVPYASRGERAMKIAKGLALATWPRERAVIVERLYRCVIFAGSELYDILEEEDEAHADAFRARCQRETFLWEQIANLACSSVRTAQSARAAGLYVDDFEDAPCEAISALYALLTCKEGRVCSEECSEAFAALHRAAYGILAAPTLLQAAVVGLDARIADVPAVEKALDAALAEADERDEDAAIDSIGSPAASAGLREELSALLAAPSIDADLGWALTLRYLLTLPMNSSCRERLVNYTRETKAVPTLMKRLADVMPLPENATTGDFKLPSRWKNVDWNDATAPSQMFDAKLSREVLIYAALLHALPASVRTFVSDMKPQRDAKRLEAATAAAISPTLVEAEFKAVSAMTFAGEGAGSMNVKPNVENREFLACYEIDESSLELSVKLPTSYPLAPAELSCTRLVGITEASLRRWMLGISVILKHQNGAVAQGLLQWHRNIDAEFAGIEPCPICYAVIQPVDQQKPRLRCRQCSNKFHATCLYTWFRTSSKSTCPLCQTPWGTSYR